MRVAFIHPFLYRYARGIERFLFRLANALADLGVEVEILTWRWPNPIVIDHLSARVRVRVLPTSRYFAGRCVIPFYTYHLVRRGYDFVWIFFAGYGEAEALRLAALLRPIRYGVILHYPFRQVPHRYEELRRLGCVRRARCVVATSRFVADGVREAFDLPSTRIGSGVDTAHFRRGPGDRERARQRLGLAADDAVVLTVAALEERKGVQHVLAALPLLRQWQPRVKYVVAGEGPYRRELEARVEELGLLEVVRLPGASADVLPYYQAADVFALLSHGEAAPLAPLEAMSVGLPVVVARQPPFDEIIRDDAGVLVSEEDPADVARAIHGYIADPLRTESAGAAGQTLVAREFTWESIAQRYLACCSGDGRRDPIQSLETVGGGPGR